MSATTVCPGCTDTSWFEFRDAHNVIRSTRCACQLGMLRTRADEAPFSDRVPEDQWRPCWPDGLPTPDDSWCTPAILSNAGLPIGMHGWTRASYPAPTDPHVAMADAWIAERGRRSDVVLFGSHGTGKSGLAVVMLRGAAVRGASCRYTLASDLLREIRSTFRADAPADERAVLERFATPDVLLLDELNVKATEFAEDTFNWLVETRHRTHRATLITTNIGGALDGDAAVDELSHYLGPLIFDRLRERAGFWPMNGDSLRRTFGETVRA